MRPKMKPPPVVITYVGPEVGGETRDVLRGPGNVGAQPLNLRSTTIYSVNASTDRRESGCYEF